MRVEAMFKHVPIDEVVPTAVALEAAGVDAIADSESHRDPMISMAMAATVTDRVALATSVTIAFPRSPMVVAYGARNLQDYSGRFRLGLGTQVRRHIEDRFDAPWDSPGPRLRDYVLALRAIWRAWETGEPLDHHGRFYAFTLMTPEFDLGPPEHGPIPVEIAAVNAYNLELAGELCDGVRLHPFITPAYLREVVWPRLRAGAERGGRSLEDGFVVTGGGFVATGADSAEVDEAREHARKRVAFYGSTKAYRPVLEHHGWGDLQPELNALVRARRWDEMAGLVTDDVLDEFCVAAPYERIAVPFGERYSGLVSQVQLFSPALGSAGWDGFAAACKDWHSLP